MIVLGRHRPLAHGTWSELAVRTAIEDIAADAIDHFDPDRFWPGHPNDGGVEDGNPSFYWGAAGVIWALDYLHRIGATRVSEDFRPVLPKLLERTITAFESNSPTDYAKHGSLLFGDMGAALVAMRLAPTPILADLVHSRAEANMGLPIRELMWGMPGSMLAAIHMAEMTQEARWRGLLATTFADAPFATAEFDALLLAAGRFSWAAGPLTKGANLCHGTGGNGYAFLKLYHRTNDPIWLDRARQFAMTAIVQYRGAQVVVGRGRYSLWTGDVGLAIYLWDCITGEPRFPTIDVF